MKTAEQFVNEECAVYNAETLVKAVAARDRQVAEACALLVAEFSRPHWTASRHLDDRDDAEAHEAVAMALEDAAKNLRARFAAPPSPETGTAAGPSEPPACYCFGGTRERHLDGSMCPSSIAAGPAPEPTGTKEHCSQRLAFGSCVIHPGPAPEPVKPPATCAEWCSKGKCEVKGPHEIHFTRNGDYTWRTPAAGTAPKGER